MTVARGEVYFVDLAPNRGREQTGVRPVVVVSNDAVNKLPLVVTVVPGTDGANVKREFPTSVRVSSVESGLPTETVFLCFQIRALDASRFPARPAGRLGMHAMNRISEALRYCLDLRSEEPT